MGRFPIWVLIGAMLAASSVFALGDDQAENEKAAAGETQEQEDKPENERYRILPIPIIITEPAIGEGLGVALALFHPVKGGKAEDEKLATLDSFGDFRGTREAPPVVTGVAAAYTNNETWIAGVGHFIDAFNQLIDVFAQQG